MVWMHQLKEWYELKKNVNKFIKNVFTEQYVSMFSISNCTGISAFQFRIDKKHLYI